MIASFHNLAKVELNEAARYYERRSPGLGTNASAPRLIAKREPDSRND